MLDIDSYVKGLEVQLAYLIGLLATTYDTDELNKLSGRMYQLHLIIENLKSEKDDK